MNSSTSSALDSAPRLPVIAMVGNPNVGKTSIFNRMANLLAKTSNFAGTTVERRQATIVLSDECSVRLVDLPGLYSFESEAPDEKVARSFILGEIENESRPTALLLVLDATNLERTLFVAGQALEHRIPTVVAVNMCEVAERKGLQVNYEKLASELKCPVVPVSARTGEGFDRLRTELCQIVEVNPLEVLAPAPCDSCGTCPYADGYRWAATLAGEATYSGRVASTQFTEKADRFLTHPFWGAVAFSAVMLGIFSLVFWLAAWPMDWLDGMVGSFSESVGAWLPAGDFNRLVTDGVIAGVGGVLIFLPQICLLFFTLAVLEDSGYLSRAVLVVDRWMRRVGLPGQAFVPLLAAHACAIPAIMATKVIENRRDRLAAILVIPLMTCSARLPVYAMIAAMLFPDNALYAASLFAGSYALGMFAAFGMAWLLKRSLLPGTPSPLILDLPPYRTPSLRNAWRQAVDRGWMFIRDAGTVILFISIGIWVLSTYPKQSDASFDQQVAAVQAEQGIVLDDARLEQLRMKTDQEFSLLGRAGKVVQPVFAPLGFDWRTSVGVLASFAAREVVVSTISVLYGLGDDADAARNSLVGKLHSAEHEDGSKVFGPATCVSLLVFFVLAMQCLPTQAVTKKETGSWKWAAFQFGYMTLLAYGAAFVARHITLWWVG